MTARGSVQPPSGGTGTGNCPKCLDKKVPNSYPAISPAHRDRSVRAALLRALRLMENSAWLPHDEDSSMQAREFMTKEPVTVSPDTPTPEIAKLLLAHGISAAPVVNGNG